jgi:3-oxoacyl-[acyl-carrier protein] reductase
MFDLNGKVAIVTGASAVSARYRRSAGCPRRARHCRRARRQCDRDGGRDSTYRWRGRIGAIDVTDAASIDAMVEGVLARHGRVDVLVNNAGITRDQLMLRLKRTDWDEVIATNLTSAYTCVQAVLKPMIKQRAGRIVSISSVVGQMGNAGQANYAASKAGLIGFQHGAGARGRVAQYHR